MYENDLGGLEEKTAESKEETAVVPFEEKKKKAPFHIWKVGEREYRLKLTTNNILGLENKYRRNITSLLMDEDIPPLSIMLTIIQAAMKPFEHGIDYVDIQKIYETWVNGGGNQQLLFTNVVLPTMAVSGFFMESQLKAIMRMAEEAEQM